MQKYRLLLQKHPALHRVLSCFFVLLTACLITLLGRGWSKFYTGSWDGYSELLSVGRITQLQQRQTAPGGFLGVYTAEWGDGEGYALLKDNAPQNPADYHSYVHQSGLQGDLFGLLARVLLPVTAQNGETRLNALYFVNCALFYALALILCRALQRRFGTAAGLFALAAVLFAPWLQTGAKNLYWVLWTWLLPCCAAVGQCAFWRKNGRFSRQWLAAMFAAVLIRCLCGFEYISTILILAETPLALCWVEQNGARRPWFFQMLKTGLAALAAVAAALGIWLWQCFAYYGSWAKAADAVLGTVLARAGAEAMTGDAASALTAELSAGGVIHQFLTDGTVLIELGGLQITMLPLVAAVWCVMLLAVLAGGVLFYAGHKTQSRALSEQSAEIFAFWVLCYAASVSWMVLAKGHAALHTHLTPMLWHFATVPAGMALIGFYAERAAKFFWEKLLRKKENRG